ncbi:hypothetical protein AB0H00_14300 [Nocardia sp. NPDC023852]|uniref:hypothetical protein n=1 Tax=Nocardia sp. NPDC023852 TaxID=3154697 RepID=UPI003410BA3B
MAADPTMADEPSNLDEWFDHISVVAGLLEDLLPDDIVLDYSMESLFPLEGAIQASGLDEMGSSFTGAVAAYLGETLIGVANGRWDWDDTPGSPTAGQPLVFADDALGLPPVAPVDLVEKSGVDIFEETYTLWAKAAQTHAAAHPELQPVRQPPPRRDPVAPEELEWFEGKYLQVWLVECDREFGNWVARFGAGHTWDFSLDSVDALVQQLYRITPTPEQFRDPANAVFADGASWYLGEILRHAAPSYWGIRHRGETRDDFDVTQESRRGHSWSPAAALHAAVQDGHPLNLLRRIESWAPRKVPAVIPPLTECLWTGTAWLAPSHMWGYFFASRLESLREVGIPLDHSADSLRRFEELLLDAGPDPELDAAVAAYLGETLLLVGGGKWSGTTVEMGGGPDPVSVAPIDLVRLARRRRDGVTFTRVHSAWERRAHELRARSRDWRPMRSPAPCPVPAPPVVQTWVAEREREFPDWVARYGADHTWDFSRESLEALTSVILAVTPTRGELFSPDNATFLAGAFWYFGEVLRRVRPSHWRYIQYLRQPQPDDPLQCLEIAILDSYDSTQSIVYLCPRVNPAVFFGLMLSQNDRDRLNSIYRSWVNGTRADRAKKAMDRRERKKSRRKQSDADYLASWLSDRERGFPDWVAQFGADHTWDFSPESLDTLEDLILEVAPLPEQLLEDKTHLAFLDGAAWYCGEVFRQARPLRWHYNRKAGIDCYLVPESGGPGSRELVDTLAGIYLHYDRGVLRRIFGR